MPRFKPIDRGKKLLPIDLSVQLLPGTFEHALSHLIDHELDLRVLDDRFRNDDDGAPALRTLALRKAEKIRANPHKTSKSEFRSIRKPNSQKIEIATALAGAS
ncbi:MAG: hypothetical protein ACKVP2_11640 [Burkholderiales bacterium]